MPAERSAARPRPDWWQLAGGATLLVVATWLHVEAGYRLPRPWPDESHFIAPALALVRDGSLAVPALNAPQGIFWMPSGYYVVQVPLLALGVDALAAGRLLSLVGVVVFAVAAAAAAVRTGVPRLPAYGAVAVWVCLPRVVTIGNIARMEGPVLAVAGVSAWLIAAGRWPLAVAVSWLAPLIHPIGLVVSVAVTAAGVVGGARRKPTRGEVLALGIVALLWVAQVAYFAAHAGVAAAHLEFQLTRKAGRAITLRWWHWLLLAGTAAAGAVATLRWWRAGDAARRTVWTLLALAGALVLVDVVGREMWYELLGRETAVLLVVLAAFAAAGIVVKPRATPRVGMAVAAGVTAAVVLVAAGVAVRQTTTSTWYGMRADAASREEWRVFTQLATRHLQRLDAQDGPRQTVVIDPLSGFGQEVFARRWERLSFVQPTPVTRLPVSAGDYVLATPGAPFVTRGLLDDWGAPAPVVEARSPQGTYALQLFQRPAP